MQRLFVYGTLAPGRVNHGVLKDIPGSWQAATLRGILFEEGWGAAMDCPGIVPSADGDEVEGFVFSSGHLEAHWPMLDAFEGDSYQRISVTIRVNGTHDVEAYVYALKRGTTGR